MNEWLENMEAPRRDMVVRCLTAGSFKVPQVPQQQCASKEANLNVRNGLYAIVIL